MNGVIVINKLKGFTSFDVVAKVRGITKQKKVGHTGTLDPLATGVLPILLGSATKAQDILPDSDKEYIAQFHLGLTTDTLDITGNLLTENESSIKQDELCDVVMSFKGEQLQCPPMYSAIKKDGVRLYELARQGIEIEREKRPINIKEIELLSFDETSQIGEIRVLCSKGTYIRSLVSDIGQKLACGAVMTELKRTQACGYNIDEAISLEELQLLSDNDNIADVLRETESIFAPYKQLAVTDAQSKRFKNGGALDISRTKLVCGCVDSEIYRVKSPNGDFLGLGITDTSVGQIKIYKMM